MRYILCILFFGLIMSSCKEEKECEESEATACNCFKNYAPVCGCNEKTYSNACVAECYGITTYQEGACQ